MNIFKWFNKNENSKVCIDINNLEEYRLEYIQVVAYELEKRGFTFNRRVNQYRKEELLRIIKANDYKFKSN